MSNDKRLTSQTEDFSAWYNEIVQQAELASRYLPEHPKYKAIDTLLVESHRGSQLVRHPDDRLVGCLRLEIQEDQVRANRFADVH